MKPMTEQHLAILRRHMVEVIEIQADLMTEELGKERLSARVLDAMRRVPRHYFVPGQLAALAYHDTPLPIGLALLAGTALEWWRVDFGALDYARTMRLAIPGATLTALGLNTVFASFFASILGLRRRRS